MKEKQKYNYLIKYVIVLAILIVMTVLACIIPTGIDLTVGDSIQDISSNITNTAYNVWWIRTVRQWRSLRLYRPRKSWELSRRNTWQRRFARYCRYFVSSRCSKKSLCHKHACRLGQFRKENGYEWYILWLGRILCIGKWYWF